MKIDTLRLLIALAAIFLQPIAPQQCFTTTVDAGGLPTTLHHASRKKFEQQHLRHEIVTSNAEFRAFNTDLTPPIVCDDMPTTPGALKGARAFPWLSSAAPTLPTTGDWYITTDKDVVYEPRACILRRLTSNGARSCFRGHSIAMVGDSVSRYMFLDLAYFIVHGKHHPRYHHGDSPHLVAENEWGSWAAFYNGSTEVGIDAHALVVELYVVITYVH